MKIVKDEPSHQYLFRDENPGFMDKIFLTKYERNDHDLWMFNQDFTNLFRSQNQSMDNLFSIDSNDKELTEKLFQNIQTRYSPYSVDGTIRELVKEIAQSLICFGSSYYFLHIETDGIPFRLVPINAETVFCLLGVYFQYIPKRIERNWDQDDKELSREIRILDRDKLICFNIPGTLKLILSKQNRILTTLYKH
ncbi:MAG: hypothetical protein OXF46_09845, partial [Rhodobacteraceae bacterium]|nr:hypothetical protein [Paracoccaceae bacterium]